MTTFQKLIDEYGRSGDTETMEHLTKKVNWFVEKVRCENAELAEHFLTKVDILLNPHFTKESAKMVVDKMENKDGSTGEHWSYETAEKVLHNQNLDFDPSDWYYVLNMIYSDYYKSGRADETYIELAEDFLDDVDAPDDKAKRYYRAMNY
jgi:hypothetical protein